MVKICTYIEYYNYLKIYDMKGMISLITLKDDNELTIPFEEKGLPSKETIKKIFTNICNGYRNRYKLELVCAYYSSNMQGIYEYMVIFKGRNKDDTGDLILFDVPPKGSTRSIVGYRYYYRLGKLDSFFKFGIDNMTIIRMDQFYDFLKNGLLLSTEKEDNVYWKSKEHIEDVLEGLADLQILYNRPKQ